MVFPINSSFYIQIFLETWLSITAIYSSRSNVEITNNNNSPSLI